MSQPKLRVVQTNDNPENNVVAKIMGIDDYDKEEVIRAAEQLLQSAKDGDIKGFAACFLSSTGRDTGHLYTSSCDQDIHSTIAAIEILKLSFLQDMLE